MASSNDYFVYIQELLKDTHGISFRKMMGKYIIYKNEIVIGGIYDNRFLIKKTKSLENSGLKEQIPYPTGKAMLLVDIEDEEEIEQLILKVYKDLK